jgi:hypothetical protein
MNCIAETCRSLALGALSAATLFPFNSGGMSVEVFFRCVFFGRPI